VATVQGKEGKFNTEYNANVPLAKLTSFNLGEDRVVAEAIQWLPVARNKEVYNSGTVSVTPEYYRETGQRQRRSNDLVISSEDLGNFKQGDVVYKPFVKLIKPTEKNIFFNSLEDLSGKSTEVVYKPFDGALRDNILSKMGKNRQLYESRISEAQSKVGSQPESTKQQLSVSAYNKAKGTNVTKEQLMSQPWAKDYEIVD